MHNRAGIDEDELISQCRKGSLKHQEILYKHFYGFAMGVGLRYCFNRDDAMEVVNDTFIKVFKAIKSYENGKSFKAWFRTIIIHTAIDRRRKDLKHQLNIELDNAVQLNSTMQATDRLNVQEILKLMDTLPALQRTIFNLYEIDGYSHDEIGVMLSIPVSSSRVYLSRAKEKMRKALTTEVYK